MLTTALPLTGRKRMNYETPPRGTTITGYIVRRMHKTRLLDGIQDLIARSSAEALAKFAVYAAAAGTSYGPALYQPRFDGPGSVLSEADPDTGAVVTVTQGERSPHYAFQYMVELADGAKISGEERILGTTVGLRGLGMPAPSQFKYEDADSEYQAFAAGTIHSELAPGLGRWRIRGYADLQLEDTLGYRGQLLLDRKGRIQISIFAEDGSPFESSLQLSEMK